MRFSVDQFPGRAVIDATGRVVGHIDRLLVDTGSWAVEALRVTLCRDAAHELGLGWSPFRKPHLDIPTGLVLAASDAVILRAAVEELAGLAEVHGERRLPEAVAAH